MSSHNNSSTLASLWHPGFSLLLKNAKHFQISTRTHITLWRASRMWIDANDAWVDGTHKLSDRSTDMYQTYWVLHPRVISDNYILDSGADSFLQLTLIERGMTKVPNWFSSAFLANFSSMFTRSGWLTAFPTRLLAICISWSRPASAKDKAHHLITLKKIQKGCKKSKSLVRLYHVWVMLCRWPMRNSWTSSVDMPRTDQRLFQHVLTLRVLKLFTVQV